MGLPLSGAVFGAAVGLYGLNLEVCRLRAIARNPIDLQIAFGVICAYILARGWNEMMGQVLQDANDLHNKAMAADEWQARAEQAELRASGLEEERKRLQARIDDLNIAMKILFLVVNSNRMERMIAKELGHRVDCDWLLDGACTCGGVVESSESTKGQGDHYPKEKAVSE